MIQELRDKVYLGDSVYAVVMGGQVILTTENGGGAMSATNVIFLEPEVAEALYAYLKRLLYDGPENTPTATGDKEHTNDQGD